MGIKDKAKKIAVAGAALATSGLSSCKDGGAVDPPPPPLECSTVDMGQALSATAQLAGATTVTIDIQAPAPWRSAEVTALEGASLTSLTLGFPLRMVLEIDDAATTRLTFTLEGSLSDLRGGSCPSRRSFTVSLDGGGGVTIASIDGDRLPLAARQQARIVLVERDGDEVELEASTPFRGARAIQWAVTGGAVVRREGERLRWRLPAEAGFYQAELVVDYGDSGLSVDTLAFEVV
jgi:hypothetical protein